MSSFERCLPGQQRLLCVRHAVSRVSRICTWAAVSILIYLSLSLFSLSVSLSLLLIYIYINISCHARVIQAFQFLMQLTWTPMPVLSLLKRRREVSSGFVMLQLVVAGIDNDHFISN